MPRKRHRIVVVDDQPDIRDLVTLLLEDEEDFDVVGVAGDGQEAVRVVEELQPDLVLMDIAMPIMSGIDAMRSLRASNSETRIVILSAHPRESVGADVWQLADGYLDKGIVVTDLIDRVRTVCNQPPKGLTTAS
jgi:DNA-binding NarL/FixJ family response regulator